MKKKYKIYYTIEEYAKDNLIKISISLFIGLIILVIKYPYLKIKRK